MRRCVLSKNIVNEEAMARWGLSQKKKNKKLKTKQKNKKKKKKKNLFLHEWT